jgi:hypothetical protein
MKQKLERCLEQLWLVEEVKIVAKIVEVAQQTKVSQLRQG